MRAFIKAFPESGALGHEGIAEGYAAGYEQPARAKCGQRPVPAGPCVETGIPVQCSCFASERFGGDFVSLPAFSGEKQVEQAKPAPRQHIIAAQTGEPGLLRREIPKRRLLFADERKYDMPSLGWKGEP